MFKIVSKTIFIINNICFAFVAINIYFLQFIKIFNQSKLETFFQPVELRFEIPSSMKIVH